MPIPYSYSEDNVLSSRCNPSAVTVENTPLASYFRRYLLQKVMSVARWTLPATWSRKYFLYALHVIGNVAIVNTDRYGVIPQHCTLSGYNVQYQPALAIITNPLIRQPMDLEIGRNCTLFSMTSDYGGVMDMVSYYASLMALVSEGFAVNTLSARLAYMFAADSSNIAESMKKAADKILSGQPYVVADKKLFNEDGEPKMHLFLQNLAQNFIAPEQMSLLQQIENQFDMEIGLPAARPMKSERMLSGEVDNGKVESRSRMDMWLDSWKESCQQTKEMFGLDVSVEWREDGAVYGDGS